MGQRVNYILKENNTLKIFYHHWRANVIASDLYLGAEKFIAFVGTCKETDELINEPWIEGCVFVDINNKKLAFWYWEFPKITSVEKHYLFKLSNKWNDWDVKILKKRMYDIEKLTGINYIKKQTFDRETILIEEIKNDIIKDWVRTIILIKETNNLFVAKTGDVDISKILSSGQDVIPILREKKNHQLDENESEYQDSEILVIDVAEKKIFSNDCHTGLWENYHHLWEGFSFKMGDSGIIEILEIANIKASKNIGLPKDEVLKNFNDLISTKDNFNPKTLAQDFAQDFGSEIEFNPNFYDNPKAKVNFIQKIKDLLSDKK